MIVRPSKQCFKCGVTKSLDEFYRHCEMADGHLNKCKECTKQDTREDYRKDLDKHKQYHRQREQDPQRKELKLVYQATRRQRHPDRYRAYSAVGNAVRDGRLIKQPCCYCGAVDTEAHHADYSKPLDVRWVCFPCHRTVEHGQMVYSNHQRGGNDVSL
jgi:hypothetical protein